jgi:hypothetical protein
MDELPQALVAGDRRNPNARRDHTLGHPNVVRL